MMTEALFGLPSVAEKDGGTACGFGTPETVQIQLRTFTYGPWPYLRDLCDPL
jgi:hypothetical protein